MPQGPPVGTQPEQLWRSLLPFRPTVPLEIKLSVFDEPLRVQAITAAHEMVLSDDAQRYPQEIRSYRLACSLIVACVYVGDRPAFSTTDEVSELYEQEIASLSEAVGAALDRVSPSYIRSDWREWKRQLEIGARHPSNTHLAWALSQCCNCVAMSERVELHPERWWGCAVADLCDSSWMVFRAARAIYG